MSLKWATKGRREWVDRNFWTERFDFGVGKDTTGDCDMTCDGEWVGVLRRCLED